MQQYQDDYDFLNSLSIYHPFFVLIPYFYTCKNCIFYLYIPARKNKIGILSYLKKLCICIVATYIAHHPYINTAMLKIIDLKTKGNLNLARKLNANILKYTSLF